MTSQVLRGCIGACVALAIVGCEKSSPDGDKSKSPPTAPAASAASQTATPSDGSDEKAIAASFTEFAPKFVEAMQLMNKGQTWSLKSADVERTTSVVNPLKGKLTCEFVIAGKSWEYESRWRFKAEFIRVKNAWTVDSSTTEVLIKDRLYQDAILGLMDQTLSIQAKTACKRLEQAP